MTRDTLEEIAGVKIYKIALGPVGRPEASQLNNDLEHRFIPTIVQLLKSGKLVPNEYQTVGGVGIESALDAFARQQSGQAGSKVVVNLQKAEL